MGRGELFVDGGRSEPVPGCGAISDECVYELALCNFTEEDKRRMRQWERFAVTKIFHSDESLCRQDPTALCEAVQYLEECEPRLDVCESYWGACALFYCSLGYRRQRLHKEQRQVRASAGSAGEGNAATTECDGDEGGGDSCERGVSDGGEGGVEDGGEVGVGGRYGSGGGGTDAEDAIQHRLLAQLP